MELGGNAPFVVTADADLDAAVDATTSIPGLVAVRGSIAMRERSASARSAANWPRVLASSIPGPQHEFISVPGYVLNTIDAIAVRPDDLIEPRRDRLCQFARCAHPYSASIDILGTQSPSQHEEFLPQCRQSLMVAWQREVAGQPRGTEQSVVTPTAIQSSRRHRRVRVVILVVGLDRVDIGM